MRDLVMLLVSRTGKQLRVLKQCLAGIINYREWRDRKYHTHKAQSMPKRSSRRKRFFHKKVIV